MKTLISGLLILLSIKTFAIAFITEEQVAEHLEADKVIEVSKYNIEKLLKDPSKECRFAIMSKSGRSYIVKKDKVVSIYLTSESLAGLKECGEL